MYKRLPITFWATLFVTVVCVSLLASDAWRSWNAREVLLADTERAAANLARAMAQQADDTIKAADTSLADVVERLEADSRAPAALARLHRVMTSQVGNLPQLNGLYAYDEAGRWLVNSRPVLETRFNNADREYFKYHRANPGRGPYIGVPVISRSTGKWVLPVSRRVNHADGSFAGVALATIDVEYLKRFQQSLDIGKHGAVILVSNGGTTLLRRPFSPELMGRDLRDSPLYQAYMQGKAGTGIWRSTLDGEVRLNSFRALENYPLFVSAALSKDEVLEHWRRDTFLHTLGVGMLAVLLGFFGRRLVRQIHLRLQAEQELLQARDALESLNRQLEKMALQDGLTGLANRRQFDVTLGNEFSRAVRQGSELAFIMIDVDYFKQYNDLQGHSAGDDCLRALSRSIRMQTPKRPGDLAARYGGEEIGVLLPNTDAEGARAVAERIRAAVEALQMPHPGSRFQVVTVSAGVAAIKPQRGVDQPGALVEAADRALYAAKSAGRNRVGSAA
ncbi:GGDEF domain-containing protein [Massilia sp. NR 4-1]|uniref:sensor domain-containing diguanylate cyclase n=1 Tax=Massilia sp. NR 4-1 TaxID=1678028 RepID=UPI00067B9926|nr:GGDEF domain-containing protein [Massilia sp. NR 4-1]AKU25122.1 diguanylate cyclase [Massilia sp. NR 4-1]